MKEKLRHIKQYLKTHKKAIIVLAIIKLLIKLSIVGYFLLGATECSAQSTNKLIRSGNNLYNNQKYNNATDQYSKALQKDPKNGTAYFNQSDAFYQLKEYQKALDQFNVIINSDAKPEIKSKAYHNLGNCYYRHQDYEQSAKAYKNALKLNPGDIDTKYNLMMALAKIKSNPNNKNEKGIKPSEYAKKLKQQADSLIAGNKFTQAYLLMATGMNKDNTVSYYKDFIQKTKDISDIIKNE